MALINHERKFIYLFEPHTASRATEVALSKLEGSRSTGNRHAGLLEIINDRTATQQQLTEYRIFCTVRNPLDSFITRWMCKSHTHSKDKMADDMKARLIPLTNRGIHAGCTDFIWFEHLDEDMQSVFGVTMPEADPTHKNKHKKARWQAYFNDTNLETFNKVAEACRPYSNKFGYRPFIVGTKVGVALDNHHRQHIFNTRKPV